MRHIQQPAPPPPGKLDPAAHADPRDVWFAIQLHASQIAPNQNDDTCRAQLRGDYDRAAQLHHESLALFPSDYHIGLIWAYHSLGETALGLGQFDQAARWLAQGLALSRTLSDQASIAWRLAGLGSVAALDEAPERAARLWGAAEGLRQTIGCRPAPAARATYQRAMAMARGQLGEEAFAAAWAVGRALPLEQAIAEALQLEA